MEGINPPLYVRYKCLEADYYSDRHQYDLSSNEQTKQRCSEFVPFVQGDTHQTTNHAYGSGPEHVGEAVAELECQNSGLSGQVQHVSQRCHDGH